MTQITRRRLFGLAGALLAVAAVPAEKVTAATAAPAPPAVAPAIAPAVPAVPDGGLDFHWIEGKTVDEAFQEILADSGWRPELGDPIAGGSVGANLGHLHDEYGCVIPIEATTTAVKGGLLHVTVTADTSQLRSELADLEARARRLAVYADGSRWSDGPEWGA